LRGVEEEEEEEEEEEGGGGGGGGEEGRLASSDGTVRTRLCRRTLLRRLFGNRESSRNY